jgi:protein-disulfide isomerase
MTQETSNRTPLLALLAASLLAAIGGYLLWRGTANDDPAIAVSGMSSAERKATEAVVRAYILEHPEILTEAAQILQQREMAKRLATVGSALTKPFLGAVAGNPAGNVTLVEFTDYSCGFCRASVADVQKLIAADTDVRVVYRELPILAPESREAAKWALAAAKQGKHKAFHDAMFAGERPNEASIRAAALAAGLDMTRAAADAASPEIAAEIRANLAMMQQVGFNGTPTFVIGDAILEGALGHDALKEAVAKARKKA